MRSPVSAEKAAAASNKTEIFFMTLQRSASLRLASGKPEACPTRAKLLVAQRVWREEATLRARPASDPAWLRGVPESTKR
jgi:hypothetical protein